MPVNEFVPFAWTAAANVVTQATYTSRPTTATGYEAGIAESAMCNKTWRQGTFVAAAVSQLAMDMTAQDIPDDGDLPKYVARLKKAIQTLVIGDPVLGIPAVGTPEAPADGGIYARQNRAWVPRVVLEPVLDNYVQQCPQDNVIYGRQNRSWVGPIPMASALDNYVTHPPQDGVVYGRQNMSWVGPVAMAWQLNGVVYEAPYNGTVYGRQNNQWVGPVAMASALNGVVYEAPIDGQRYARRNGGWEAGVAVWSELGNFVQEAPRDGVVYGRQNGGWTGPVAMASSLGNFVPEAPRDGNLYGRQNSSWSGPVARLSDLNNYMPRSGGTFQNPGDIVISGFLQVNNRVGVSGTLTCNNLVAGGGINWGTSGIYTENGNFFVGSAAFCFGGCFCGGTDIGSSEAYISAYGNNGEVTLRTGGANKPGGGPWNTYSDARLKKNIAPYEQGLPAVRQLEPITYQYVASSETRDTGVTYHGLEAEKVVEVMPEMITTKPVMLGETEVEAYIIDSNALTYALINAVKELASRVEQLEAGR